MTNHAESARARRYLLGEATDEECAAIEQDYLAHADVLDRIAAAEDDLIEEYLARELRPGDRARFEQAYLPVPHRRVRVDTIRRLMAQAAQSAPGGSTARVATTRIPRGPWIALAASLLFGALGGIWVSSPFGDPRAGIAEGGMPAPAPVTGHRITTAPRLFAVTLSPVTVRSASGTGIVVIPVGTDVAAIHLERDVDYRTLTARRASIHAVGGGAVWQGSVATDVRPPPGTVARVDVPAVALPPDDYLLALYGTDEAGIEREWTQYFLRVRYR